MRPAPLAALALLASATLLAWGCATGTREVPEGIPCTTAEDCQALGGPCAEASCVAGRCAVAPQNEHLACDDGAFCTEYDTCVAGACTGVPRHCASIDACHVGSCNEAAARCDDLPGNEGEPCDDGDPCTESACAGGECAMSGPASCAHHDTACSTGVCEPGVGCKLVPRNEDKPCDDGSFCTDGEACHAGACTGGVPHVCTTAEPCLVPKCDDDLGACIALPGNDGAACDDESPCTVDSLCKAGVCGGGAATNEGAACEDGFSCTPGGTCGAGHCQGEGGPLVHFAETFANNAQGWLLDPDWTLRPALPWLGEPGDPAQDHSPTGPDGLAGVVFSGNPPQPGPLPVRYLESPPFDTSAGPGPVVLGFHRWLLNSCEAEEDTVEVWNGAAWVLLWTSAGKCVHDPPPDGPGWTHVTYDLTPHRGPSTRLRFGYRVTAGGAQIVGSWNIDDLLVASAPCP